MVMDDPSNPAQKTDTIASETSCDLSLDEHIEMTMTALTLFGVGIGCETQYHALLVITEIARRLHNHPDFDPREIVEDYVRRAEAVRAQSEPAQPEVVAVLFPDNGKVH